MRLQNYLTELLDTKVKLKIENTDRDFNTFFNAGGYNYGFYSHLFKTANIWGIVFSRFSGAGEVTDMLNDLDSKAVLKVFSAVKQSMKNFVKEKNPEQFFFSAKTEESSRVKLYDRFAKIMSKELKMKFIKRDTAGEFKYTFTK
jgi:hypothetical protein